MMEIQKQLQLTYCPAEHGIVLISKRVEVIAVISTLS